MPKFRITFVRGDPEEVEADTYEDEGSEGRWITFTKREGAGTSADPHRTVKVLRVRAENVQRVERIG